MVFCAATRWSGCSATSAPASTIRCPTPGPANSSAKSRWACRWARPQDGSGTPGLTASPDEGRGCGGGPALRAGRGYSSARSLVASVAAQFAFQGSKSGGAAGGDYHVAGSEPLIGLEQFEAAGRIAGALHRQDAYAKARPRVEFAQGLALGTLWHADAGHAVAAGPEDLRIAPPQQGEGTGGARQRLRDIAARDYAQQQAATVRIDHGQLAAQFLLHQMQRILERRFGGDGGEIANRRVGGIDQPFEIVHVKQQADEIARGDDTHQPALRSHHRYDLLGGFVGDAEDLFQARAGLQRRDIGLHHLLGGDPRQRQAVLVDLQIDAAAGQRV